MESKIPKRKNLRIKEYNYSEEGFYFITICTKNKECILSKINNNKENNIPELLLYKYGKYVKKYITIINQTYKNVKIENFVIMPNHIHFICHVYKTTQTISPANSKVPSLISTLKRFVNKECGYNIWQRNYYEHIIRNENEYIKILEYIENNPYKWKKDIYFIE